MTAPAGPSGQFSGQVKACCAAAYESDLVALLLGESYHPGGTRLTRRLADRLDLRRGQRVLDVAGGPGGTALMLARDYAAQVDAVDLGPATVARARARAESARLGERVRFHVGDAERLPFADGVFDAVICECAFCTFPDKPTAAAEIARVLRPGGRLGLADITIDPDQLDDRLTGLAGWVACIADARPAGQYVELLSGAGLRTTVTEWHDDALTAMTERIEARLRVLRISRPSALAGIDTGTITEMTALARDAVCRGAAGYVLLIAEKRE
jgi:arsenite methyltransferase